jgi:hypothetical protein
MSSVSKPNLGSLLLAWASHSIEEKVHTGDRYVCTSETIRVEKKWSVYVPQIVHTYKWTYESVDKRNATY